MDSNNGQNAVPPSKWSTLNTTWKYRNQNPYSNCESSFLIGFHEIKQILRRYDEATKALSEIQKQQAQLISAVVEMDKTTKNIEERISYLEETSLKPKRHSNNNQGGHLIGLQYLYSKIGVSKFTAGFKTENESEGYLDNDSARLNDLPAAAGNTNRCPCCPTKIRWLKQHINFMRGK